MSNLVLHPVVESRIEALTRKPPHALLLIGPAGSGKICTAIHIAAKLLQVTREDVVKYPHFKYIEAADSKSISIDEIRLLQQFMTLRVPSTKEVSRMALIEDSQRLTTEAQNALLKILEEPPAGTVIVLTATSLDALLPTIQSRVQLLQIIPPSADMLGGYFIEQNYSKEKVGQALLLSGGLPGTAQALLSEQTDHPLHEAVTQAKSLLRASVYQRLALVDGLSKNKQLCVDTVQVIGQMSRMALMKAPADSEAANRWQHILEVTYEARRRLQSNTQTKLILTNLMLDL